MKTLIVILVVGVLNSQPTLANTVESSAKAGFSNAAFRVFVYDDSDKEKIFTRLVSTGFQVLNKSIVTLNPVSRGENVFFSRGKGFINTELFKGDISLNVLDFKYFESKADQMGFRSADISAVKSWVEETTAPDSIAKRMDLYFRTVRRAKFLSGEDSQAIGSNSQPVSSPGQKYSSNDEEYIRTQRYYRGAGHVMGILILGFLFLLTGVVLRELAKYKFWVTIANNRNADLLDTAVPISALIGLLVFIYHTIVYLSGT